MSLFDLYVWSRRYATTDAYLWALEHSGPDRVSTYRVLESEPPSDERRARIAATFLLVNDRRDLGIPDPWYLLLPNKSLRETLLERATPEGIAAARSMPAAELLSEAKSLIQRLEVGDVLSDDEGERLGSLLSILGMEKAPGN